MRAVAEEKSVTPPIQGSVRDELLQDWAINRGALKSRMFLVSYRFGSRCARRAGLHNRLGSAVYKLLANWVFNVEIPPTAQIGPRFKLRHPQAIVVSKDAIIGANCTIRNSVTIGKNETGGSADKAPIIEDGVEIGSSCVIIGPVRIGRGAKLGAGALVVKDVPPGGVAVCHPAEVIKVLDLDAEITPLRPTNSR